MKPNPSRKMMLTSIGLEIAGGVAIGVGVGIELALRADIGFVVITLGSLVVVTGSMFWVKVLRRF